MPVCVAAGAEGKLVCDGYTILRAGEVPFHEDTGEFEAEGRVSVTRLHQ